jgi:NTP pyrophosphatase (non-canonical NTP hydrolase)
MLKLREGWVDILAKNAGGPGLLARRMGNVGVWVHAHYSASGNKILVYIPADKEWSRSCKYIEARLNGEDWQEVAHRAYVSEGVDSPWINTSAETVNDLDEFQTLAMRTAGDSSDDGWILEKALGLSEETGEVLGLLKKSGWHGRELDRDALRKELGDVLWYVAALAHGHGFSLSEIATANIEKLRKRYPDGFSVERSLNRGDE